MAAARYREHAAPAELGDLLSCVWRQDVGAGGHVQRVVPDGCIDLIWRAGRSLVVAGPATAPVLAELPAGTTTLGVRFRPGAGAAFLGLPLSELRDRDVLLEDLWDGAGGARGGDAARDRDVARGLTEALSSAGSAEERLRLLAEAVQACRGRGVAGPDLLVAAATRRLRASGEVSVAALGVELGVSERQLLRRFRVAVGYGPKTLARVLRFQRFLATAWGPAAGAPGDETLAALAVGAGYADQAHLTRECRTLAGVSPARLLRS